MINDLEIKKFARKIGVPETTIERDYAQNWLLAPLTQKQLPLALKGGTGIRKVFIKNYRFSDDLDFSIIEDIRTNGIKNAISETIKMAKMESGVDFNEDFKFEKTNNGYVFSIYFRILRMTGSPLKIKIDITKMGNEIIIFPLKSIKINYPYSDDCSSKIQVYSIEEIFAEKIRALFQRTRPRDLYDIWQLSIYGLVIPKEIYKKFKFKHVKADYKSLIDRKEDFKKAWEKSLVHQLKTLPAFNKTFENVTKIMKKNFMKFMF
ncbi:MAG: nucleotidyl transferase AbiEii/AbiGii toxin family protein [Candidatus Helarchaeota archaeon]